MALGIHFCCSARFLLFNRLILFIFIANNVLITPCCASAFVCNA